MTDDRLSPEARRYLPALARLTLEAACAGRPRPAPDTLDLPLPPEAAEKRGVFVTLTAGGRLRGCIGFIEGVAPLLKAVQENALSAGFKDPRFEPVMADELDGLDIEVSVLTPLRAVDGPDAIDIPRHGVVLARDGRRSVFLPQVAAEQGWDRDTTLTQLALKAGLPADAWRSGASLWVFEAEAVHEEGP